MKTPNKQSIIFCCILFSLQFTACKKDNITALQSASVNNATATTLPLGAWYKFNGNNQDYSGNNNNLLGYEYTYTTDSKGNANGAVQCNGYSTHLFCDNSPSLNPVNGVTLVAVVKPMGFNYRNSGQSRIFTKGDQDNSLGSYFLGYRNTGAFFGSYGDNIYSESALFSAGNNVQLNQWSTLIYTYNGVTAKFYVDKKLVDSSDVQAPFTPIGSNLNIGEAFYIRDQSFVYFYGAIDEIRIYNGAASELQAKKITDEIAK